MLRGYLLQTSKDGVTTITSFFVLNGENYDEEEEGSFDTLRLIDGQAYRLFHQYQGNPEKRFKEMLNSFPHRYSAQEV